MVIIKWARVASSLVPRLSKGEGEGEREPGFNRLRMRQIIESRTE